MEFQEKASFLQKTTVPFEKSLNIAEISEIPTEHRAFMSLLKAGQNLIPTDENLEAEQALLYAKGDRKEAAEQFLQRTLSECKNEDQKNAVKMASDLLKAYYYGTYNPNISKTSLKHTPMLTIIGVRGAGKSWVVRKIRTWIDICLRKNDLPYQSSEFEMQRQDNPSDPMARSILQSINHLPKGKYGKSIALAFRGCAAGIIKGFTIHHTFSFSININKQVKTGELLLPELKNSIRQKLLECWRSVKLIIIDEVYMLKVEWLSLIYERLKQIFNSDVRFPGIPILIAGDPRQIVPVNGKPLFAFSKYFNLQDSTPSLNEYGIVSLSEREEKGFLLYASSEFAIALTKFIRLASSEFAKLNMKIAQYELTPKDLKEINNFYRPLAILQKAPWIDSPWLFPTWKEVNEHLQLVTERAKKLKGIFRAWSQVVMDKPQSMDQARIALKTFYRSNTDVSPKFTCPLPYIDYFLGQIICLKKNWNPTWNLFKNAKAFVLGIKCENQKREQNPLMTLEEAVDITLEFPNALSCALLVKPLLQFKGPSAIPGIPGILEVPCVKTNGKISGCRLTVEGRQIFPANAFSQHQSQGSTFDRCVSSISETCKAYGMANVFTSRTPKPENFSLAKPVTIKTLRPCPEASYLVENEYNRLAKKASNRYNNYIYNYY